MTNFFTNLSSLLTYDESGPVDYLDKVDDFEDAYAAVESDAGFILVDNFQDKSFRSALNLAGWKPQGKPHEQAVEWYEMDYEYAQTPVSHFHGLPRLEGMWFCLFLLVERVT